jgi:Flp pilus assembly protein TadD
LSGKALYDRAGGYTDAVIITPECGNAHKKTGGFSKRKQDMFYRYCGKNLQAVAVAQTYDNPMDAEGYRAPAKEHLDQLDDLDAAIQDFTHALRLEPENAFAYNRQGYAYYMMKD